MSNKLPWITYLIRYGFWVLCCYCICTTVYSYFAVYTHIFVHIIHEIIIPIVIPMYVILIPMYNVYPYFPSEIWAKKCTFYIAKYGS